MEFKNKELEKFEKKLESQKVAVIGLGVSNIPLIDYLHSKNADVSVFDDREEEKINKEIIEKIIHLREHISIEKIHNLLKEEHVPINLSKMMKQIKQMS